MNEDKIEDIEYYLRQMKLAKGIKNQFEIAVVLLKKVSIMIETMSDELFESAIWLDERN